MSLEQTNKAIRFMAFFTASKIGKTGLVAANAITVDVYGPSSQLVTNGSVTEVGGGWYSYQLSSGSNTTAGEYVAVFKSTDATCTMQHVSDRCTVGRTWVANVDAAVSSRSAVTAAAIWNYSERTLTNFGYALDDPDTAPTVSATGGGSTGGSLQAGVYYVKYTFSNAAGETLASPESSSFTVAEGNIPRVTMPALPSGAISYNIYLTAADGDSGSETLYATDIISTTHDLEDATVVGQQPPPTVNTTNDLVTSIWESNARTLTDFDYNVTVGTNNDKTGYSLASSGLDSIAVSDPGAITNMTSIPKMIVALWRYFYKKTTATSTQLKTYNNDNSTVNVTMTLSNDGTTQTKGAGA